MSVISAEELEHLRRWVREQPREELYRLDFLAATVRRRTQGRAEWAHWFRVGRLVSEELERRG